MRHHYDYQPIAGTFWMHSHRGLQEQQLMAAPLIIHSPDEMREDRQEIVPMLHDFSFSLPEALLAALNKPSPMNQAPHMDINSGSMGPMKENLNDIGFDAFLANDRTLADPEVVRVDKRGRVRLRVINGAAPRSKGCGHAPDRAGWQHVAL